MWIWIGGEGWIFRFIYFLFSVSLRCISLFVLLCYIFHISLFLTWNAKLEALTFPLSGTGGISLLGSQECAPEQKRLQPNPFLLLFNCNITRKKFRSEQIVWWAWKPHSWIIWKSGSSLIFLQLWSPQIDHGHKLGQIWEITELLTSTNWTKSRQYKASLIGTF